MQLENKLLCFLKFIILKAGQHSLMVKKQTS